MIKFDIIKYLKEEDESGNLEHARKWQVIDFSTIRAELETQMDKKQRINFLSKHYPSLYIHILRYLNLKDRAD